MKLMKKTMFALVALLSVTGYAFGYNYGIANGLDFPIVVRVQILSGGYMYDVIKPGKRVLMKFGGGDLARCLQYIKWFKYDPTDRYTGNNQYRGKNLMEIKDTGVDFLSAGPAHNAFYEIVEATRMHDAPITILPGDVYEATAKGAIALVSGIDTFACKAIDVAMKLKTGGTIGTDTINEVTNLLKEDQRDATQKTKEQLEAEKKAKENPSDTAAQELAKKKLAEAEVARKIVKLVNVLNDIDDLLITSKGWVENPVPAAIAILDTNKDFIDTVPFGQIKLLMSQGKNEEASKVFKAHIDKLKASTTKTSIDDDAMVYGCSSCDINTYNATGDTAEQKKGCSFGIAEIAGSIGELVGISICKDRELVLVPGKKEGSKDEVIAITRKGE